MTNLPLQPSAALAAAYERDIAAGINPLAFEPDPNPPQPSPEPEPFYIPPPDWEQEAREAQQRERALKEAELAGVIEAELERLAAEDTETYPAAPAKKRRGIRDLVAGRETP